MKNTRRIRGQVLSFVMASIMMLSVFGFMPVRVEATNIITVDQVAAGANHTLALLSDGRVYAWGSNSHGQLGRGNFGGSSNVPTRVTGLSAGEVHYIAAGGNSSYVIVGNRLYAWGSNSHGQLGLAFYNTHQMADMRTHPEWVHGVTINPALGVQIAAGASHVLVRSGTHLMGFGNNELGQTATNSTESIVRPSIPTQTIDAGHGNFIAAGYNHSLAIIGTGVWGAGHTELYRMGGGFSTHHQRTLIPLSTPLPNIGNVEMVSGGSNFTLLLTAGGDIFAFGADNAHGRVGSASATNVFANNNQRLNQHIQSGPRHMSYIASGHNHSLAICTLVGNVFAWGENTFGQLGNGNTTHSNDTSSTFQLSQVSGLSNISSVAAGTNHSLAICANGSLWAWGRNVEGQLGNRSNTGSTVPVQIFHNNAWVTPQTPPNQTHNFTFLLHGNEYTITRFTGTVPTGGLIEFPAAGPTGNPVRTISTGVFSDLTQQQRNSITNISFEQPSQVTTIQASAFFALNNLRTITVPGSVTSIGSLAFANNPQLTDVHFLHTSGWSLRQDQVFRYANIFVGVPSSLRLTRPVGTDATTYVPFVSGGYTRNWFVSDGYAAWWTFSPATGTGPVTITGFTGPSDLSSVSIPSTIAGRTVTGIGTGVLTSRMSPALQEVIIPASIQTIATNAFNVPSLTIVRFLHTNAATLQPWPANVFGTNLHTNFRLVFPAEATGFTEPAWRGFQTVSEAHGTWLTAHTGQGLTITGFIGTGTAIRIPESIGGVPVRYIGPNVFASNTELRELIIPASVVLISPNAVSNAPNLEVVYLRHTNANVFTYFSTNAFTNVHPDFRIYFPMESTGFTTPTWEGYRAFPQRWSYTITGGNVTITGFYGTEATVVVPSSIQGFPVRTIAGEAFVNNPQIATLVIPSSVTSIQRNAVFNCRNLHTVVLEHMNAATITNFAAYAFVGVAANFRILFPYDATGFTTPVWRGYFAEPLTGEIILQHGNFEYTIRRVTLPGTGNVSRDEVVILRYLGNTANIVIPASIDGLVVAGLGDAAFFQNQTLTQITLPDTLRTIGNSTFSGASGLTTITIPASVTSIGANAFMGASNLQTARFMHQNGSLVTFGDNTFANTSINPQFRILFPAGASGFGSPQWRGLLASPYGQAPTPTPSASPTPPPSGEPRSLTVRTTDTFPGVVGAPLIFRDGVGFISMRAFALLIESNPQTEILFNTPTSGWATITGRHTNGSIINVSVTSNDHRAIVFINGVQHNETDMAGWAPQSGRARGQLRTINENGNIYLPFRAMSNIFGYYVEMINATTVQFTALN